MAASPLMFISSTEPATLKEIGISSLMPEEYGVDIFWESKLGKVGIQRKEFPNDFLASVHDGRLNREYAQMKSLDLAVLLLEGNPSWTSEGYLIRDHNGKRNAWSKTQHRHYLASVQMRGIQVHTTQSLTDTVNFVEGFRAWTDATHHLGLDVRPAAPKTWGTIANEDYVKYLYQSMPGISVITAEAIYRELGMIFGLRVSEEELMTVPGIGKGKAQKIVRMFQ